MERILVAYDGSEPANKAFAWGLDLATKYRADLHVLAVARPSEPPEDVETEAILENAQEHYEKAFIPLKEQAKACGVLPNFEIRVGHPAEQIVHFAETHHIDHIVMGHRGKTFIERWLLGSVSKRVMTYAHCTVSVVR
jgi:nucleotide-binding universal stress UspA family protein